MGKYARTEGMGSGILHQVCQVSKIHEVGLELLWRNLPLPLREKKTIYKESKKLVDWVNNRYVMLKIVGRVLKRGYTTIV